MHWDYNAPPNWRPGDFQRTVSGKLVHAPELAPSEIDFRDIANGLASECRHCGQLSQWVSVAQHSVGVHDLMRDDGCSQEACFHGLMHDCEEFLMKDMPRPLKYRDHMALFVQDQLELRRRIFKRYNVCTAAVDTVREYDELWLKNEKYHFKATGPGQGTGEGKPDRIIKIPPMGFEIARVLFRNRFLEHRPEEGDK